MKLNLDLSSVEVRTPSNYSLVPAGEYDVTVVKAELKDTKSGGAMLILGYEVMSGEHAGKVIKDTMNIVNQSAEATRIGLERLKTVANATGHKNPSKIADSDELLNLNPFLVIVDVKDDGQYKNNVVKAVIKTSTEPSTEFKAPPATTKKPWSK